MTALTEALTEPAELSEEASASHARGAWDRLADTDAGYPANHFAFQQMLNVLAEEGAERVLEVGIGHGFAIPVLAGAGLQVAGLEINDLLVEKSRSRMTELGLDAQSVWWGDIQDSTTYPAIRRDAPFDALIAMGVLPHVRYEKAALENMRALVRPGGLVFVECRNSLFSLITFNRYTHEFLMDDLLHDAPEEVRQAVDAYIRPRLEMDRPPVSSHSSTFHNPLTIPDVFRAAGFEDVVIRPFHYHAGMPILEAQLGQVFRDGSIALENEPSGWRGLFLCSAYVVQARRPMAPSQAGQVNHG